VTTLEFYEQQGGDVLQLFDSILQQTRIVESRRIEIHQLTKKYFFQWVFLWILNLFILVMAKVVLMDLFDLMKTNPTFIASLSMVILYFPISHWWWLQQWRLRIEKTL
jgi:ammonia channel protein AmtB